MDDAIDVVASYLEKIVELSVKRTEKMGKQKQFKPEAMLAHYSVNVILL